MGSSSLGSLAVDHSTTGSTSRKSVPRREVDPPEAVIVPYRSPKPLDKPKPMPLGALSPGDAFTTTLTGKSGRVLAHSVVDVSEPEDIEVKLKPSYKHPMGKRVKVARPTPREMRPVTLVVLDGVQKLLPRNILVLPT
jgi:hypothetical protein